jgi:carboxyl-terminal processing protease
VGIKRCHLKRLIQIFGLYLLFSGLFSSNSNAQFFNEQGFKFVKLFSWLESYYVDTVNLDQLTDQAIRDLLHKLDPHSSYISKEEVKEMNEPLQGNFDGIGISFNLHKDTILIISVVPGGPSQKLGILPGDRIIQIDTAKVAGVGITSRQVMAKLKGKKGTIVKVKILRRNAPELIDFAISRDRIPIHSLDASYKVNSNTGYIKLSRFSKTTMDEITPILQQFNKEKVTNLIIDLTDNGGGYLDVAFSLADEFLEKDKTIVYTKGLHSERKDYTSTESGNFEKGNVIVLIDESSASASEIFAGAIQDWDRGLIIGRRSYGKGLVQRPLTFPDGSELRLTVARYYTPSGRLIQKSYAKGYDNYENELRERIESGEIYDTDSKLDKIDTVSKYYTLMRKHVVYGGGGIIPDIIVPVDTTKGNALYRTVLSKGLLNSFVLDYIDVNRKMLVRKYPDFQTFNEKFGADDTVLAGFIQYLKGKSINFSDTDFNQSKETYQLLIKAYIANNLWTSSGFYQIYNNMNPIYLKALDAFSNWSFFMN